MMVTLASRTHQFCAGHRVVGHESKCAHLHGHNYTVTFFCKADQLDSVGRVIDFSVIKSTLCQWLEDNWDHRMLIWQEDPLLDALHGLDNSVVSIPFNPTAENMGQFLMDVVGPQQLQGTGVSLQAVNIMETGKCGVYVGNANNLV